MKKITSALLASILLFASSCSETANEPEVDVTTPEEEVVSGQEEEMPVEYAPIELSRAEQEMMEEQNGFGIDFLKAASTKEPNGNLIYSLPGITGTISMAGNFVAGDAQTEIRDIFGIEANQLDALNALNSRIAEKLSYVDEDVNTKLANSVWIDKRTEPNMSFISTMKESYKADIFTGTLYDVATMQAINTWASEKTNGMINGFLDAPLREDIKLFLVNALYFNGGWTDTFNKERTVDDIFYCYNGTKSDIKMMNNGSLALPYLANKDAKWLKLHFGNRTFAITFIMPENDINEFIATLTKADIDNFNKIKKTFGVRISIPRMDLGSDSDNIVEILKNMGISKIFDGNADFSPIANYAINGLGSMIIQKTKFEIDEEGAKAAGVVGNGVVGAPGPDVVVEVPTFTLNRPFVFILTEESSNTILFIGRIMNL